MTAVDDAARAVAAGHVHECPTEPNKGVRVTTRPTVQTWLPGSPVIPGSIWCWSHGRWEKLPAPVPLA